jgi:hypothetical protein
MWSFGESLARSYQSSLSAYEYADSNPSTRQQIEDSAVLVNYSLMNQHDGRYPT